MLSHFNSCFYSSFVFLTNVLLALYYKYYLYALLFAILIITSTIHHCHYTTATTVIDKIAIYCIVFYGGYLFYKKLIEYYRTGFNAKQYILSFLIVSTFLSNIFLYYYGYLYDCFCFSQEQCSSDWTHSLLHCLGSFGHCCVVLF
jgi:hypothetical protein